MKNCIPLQIQIFGIQSHSIWVSKCFCGMASIYKLSVARIYRHICAGLFGQHLNIFQEREKLYIIYTIDTQEVARILFVCKTVEMRFEC